MAICLAETLIATSPSFDPVDLQRRFADWRENGTNSVTGKCFDIGLTTGEAITRFELTGAALSGSTAPETSGNGGIMRLAPVPVRYAFSSQEAVKAGRLQSRTTHGSALCLACSDILVGLLVSLLTKDGGEGTDSIIARRLPELTAAAEVEFDVILPDWWARPSEPPVREDVSSSGFVVHTLDAALWAVVSQETPRDALLAAVNLADDADTVGAVTGQILGAGYGVAGLPDEWVERLAWRGRLLELADTLASLALELNLPATRS
jgi:ADP-ribosyl-[dinitrogen reductase] hydrolase